MQCEGRCGIIPRGAHHTRQLEVAAVACFLSHLLVQHDQASCDLSEVTCEHGFPGD